MSPTAWKHTPFTRTVFFREKLTIKRLNSREVVLLRPLRGIYGEMDKGFNVNKAFQFDLHSRNKQATNRCYLRGVPDEFREFDRAGFEEYAAHVRVVEALFIQEFGTKELTIKLVTAKRFKGEEYFEVSEVNACEGVRLLSFAPRRVSKKTRYRVRQLDQLF